MEPTSKMQASYELQLEVEEADILQRREEEEEFRRCSLKAHVLSFVSSVSARMVSGVARSGHDKDASGVKKYLQSPDNLAKVVSFLKTAKLSGEPVDFADALDKNYDERNGEHCVISMHLYFLADGAHDTRDEYLEKTAAQLKRMGVLRLLKQELPWQCALIEHFALVKAHLFASG